MIKKLFILALAISLTACASSRTTVLNDLRPADLSLPSDINQIVLLDRSKPPRNGWNIAESILTGEIPGAEKAAVQQALQAMKEQLEISPRYTVISANERIEGNSLTQAFPNSLDPKLITALGRKYNAQAVVSVEIFDDDFIVTNGSRKVKREANEERGSNRSRSAEVTEYYAEGIENLTIGIRVYSAVTGAVLDEQVFNESKTWSSVGETKAAALSALISHSNATIQITKLITREYIYRIAPMPVTLNRKYYFKSKKVNEMRKGANFAEVGQWAEAREVWESGLDKAEEKDGGRLAYNIAVSLEMEGNLDGALEWARYAYTEFNHKEARQYVTTLENRINNSLRLNEQMK